MSVTEEVPALIRRLTSERDATVVQLDRAMGMLESLRGQLADARALLGALDAHGGDFEAVALGMGWTPPSAEWGRVLADNDKDASRGMDEASRLGYMRGIEACRREVEALRGERDMLLTTAKHSTPNGRVNELLAEQARAWGKERAKWDAARSDWERNSLAWQARAEKAEAGTELTPAQLAIVTRGMAEARAGAWAEVDELRRVVEALLTLPDGPDSRVGDRSSTIVEAAHKAVRR